MGDRNNRKIKTGGKSGTSEKGDMFVDKLETEHYVLRTNNSELRSGVTP
jgi:hypothetical protein